MKFVITGRGFILPVIAGIILLFKNWIPGAVGLCVIINLMGIVLIAIDYFMIPDPEAFSVTRIFPSQFFLGVQEKVVVRVEYSISLPTGIIFIDHPPPGFKYEDKRYVGKLSKGDGIFELSYMLEPMSRGEHTYETAGMRLSSPIGFISRQTPIKVKDIVHVYPRLPTEKEGLQSRFYLARTESRQMKNYGPGREFAQMRDYRLGDDIKNVHWKRSARCGKLIVREYEPEQGQNIFIMIDGGRLMMAETSGLSKVDWAVASAISLAREALTKKDSIGIMGFSNTVDTYLMPSNKKIQLTTFMKTIYAFQPRFIEPDYRNAFYWMHAHVKTQSIVVIYTDFIDPYLSSELAAFIKLLKKRHRIICCAMGFQDLHKAGYANSEMVKDAVFASVVRESIYNRKKVLNELAKAKVDIVDVFPEKLCAAVLNSYIKARWKG